MTRDFSKLTCTELDALICASACHIEARTQLGHDCEHLTTIREASSALMKLALQGKFRVAAHGSARERAMANSLMDDEKDYPR